MIACGIYEHKILMVYLNNSKYISYDILSELPIILIYVLYATSGTSLIIIKIFIFVEFKNNSKYIIA